MGYKIIYTKKAIKDSEKILEAGLKDKVINLINILKENPFTPPYEKLIGDLKGAFSKRINIQHRLIYEILEDIKIVKIIRMWTHYE